MLDKLTLHHFKDTSYFEQRIKCCSISRWITLTVLFICILHLHGVNSTGKVFIRFNTYENPASLKYNGQCCDGELRANNCTDGCDYSLTVCLGHSIDSPCETNRMNLTLDHKETQFKFPSPFPDGHANPTPFDIPYWPGSMLITVYMYDQDTLQRESIDILQVWHNVTSPSRDRILVPENVTTYLLTGNRQTLPTKLSLSVSTRCDRWFYTDTCEVNCVPTDDCAGHYTCNTANGDKICNAGWEGPFCNVSLSANPDCSNEDLCSNHGLCVANGNRTERYYCCCSPGYSGDDCSQDINECASNPCGNGGTCKEEEPPSFTCHCPGRWTGDRCEISRTCSGNPCQNGGTCRPLIISVETFYCACGEFFTGDFCEISLSTSTVSTTATTPTTTETTSVTTVPRKCFGNYYGPNCLTYCRPADDCSGHYTCNPATGARICLPAWTQESNCTAPSTEDPLCSCENGGYCFKDSCCCPKDFKGSLCQSPALICPRNPCQNGGTCIEDIIGAKCQCREMFTGAFCQTMLYPNRNCPEHYYGPECAVHCQPQYECGVETGQYYCDERTGVKICMFGWIGPTCSQRDPNAKHAEPCPASVCRNEAFCLNQTCCCLPGYTGTLCHIEILECESSPCLNGGTCTDHINAYSCSCRPGFSGRNCEETLTASPDFSTTLTPVFDPCTSGPCQNGGMCLRNGTTEFTCLCWGRYVGPVCETYVAMVALNIACQANYYGPSCSVDCVEQDSCSGHYFCHPETGERVCRSGWTGTNCNERWIEKPTDPECPVFSTGCLNNGSCFNKTCCCPSGYGGARCQEEVLPCSTDPCGLHGVCVDFRSGYLCQCIAGYSGVNCETFVGVIDFSVTMLDSSMLIASTTLSELLSTVQDGKFTVSNFTPLATSSAVTFMPSSTWTSHSQTLELGASSSVRDITLSVPDLTASISSQLGERGSSLPSRLETTSVLLIPTAAPIPITTTTITPVPCDNFFCYNGGSCFVSTVGGFCVCPRSDMGLYCEINELVSSFTSSTQIVVSDSLPSVQDTTTRGFTPERELSLIETTSQLDITEMFLSPMSTETKSGSVSASSSLTIMPTSVLDSFASVTPAVVSSATPGITDIQRVPCDTFFCYNGGSCVYDPSGSTCLCPREGMGRYCEHNVTMFSTTYNTVVSDFSSSTRDLSISMPSPVTNIPTPTVDSFSSVTATVVSSTASGTTDIPPVPCDTFFCYNGGSCVSTPIGSICICPREGMGLYCDNTLPTSVLESFGSVTSAVVLSTTPGTTDISPVPCDTFFCYNGGSCAGNTCVCPREGMGLYCEHDVLVPLTTYNTVNRTSDLLSSAHPVSAVMSLAVTIIPTSVLDSFGSVTPSVISSTTGTTNIPPVPCRTFSCYNGGSCVSFTSGGSICVCPREGMGIFCEYNVPMSSSNYNTVDSNLSWSTPDVITSVSLPVSTIPTSTMDASATVTATVVSSVAPGTTDTSPVPCDTFFCYNGGSCVSTTLGSICVCPREGLGPYCEHNVISDLSLTTQDVSTLMSLPVEITSTSVLESFGSVSLTYLSSPAPVSTDILPVPCHTFFCYNGGSCVGGICLCPQEGMGLYCEHGVPLSWTIYNTVNLVSQLSSSISVTPSVILSTTGITDIPPVPCNTFFCYNGGSCTSSPSGNICLCPREGMGLHCEHNAFVSSTTYNAVVSDFSSSTGDVSTSLSSLVTNIPTSALDNFGSVTSTVVLTTTPGTTDILPVPCNTFFCYNGGSCTSSPSGNICLCPREGMGLYCQNNMLVSSITYDASSQSQLAVPANGDSSDSTISMQTAPTASVFFGTYTTLNIESASIQPTFSVTSTVSNTFVPLFPSSSSSAYVSNHVVFSTSSTMFIPGQVSVIPTLPIMVPGVITSLPIMMPTSAISVTYASSFFEMSTTETLPSSASTTTSTTTTSTRDNSSTESGPIQIIGELFITGPISTNDFSSLRYLILRSLEKHSQPEKICCLTVTLDDTNKYYDMNGNPLIRVEYTFAPPPGSKVTPVVDRDAMLSQIAQQLNTTLPFSSTGNIVYGGHIYGPHLIFQLNLIGSVAMDTHSQLAQIIQETWARKNTNCTCTYSVQILTGERYSGRYGTHVTNLLFTVSKDDVIQSVSTPERPATSDYVMTFKDKPAFYQVYPNSDTVSYTWHFNFPANETFSLISQKGRDTMKNLENVWRRYFQRANGPCSRTLCNIHIRTSRPELHYTDTGNDISNLIYYLTLNGELLKHISYRELDLQSYADSFWNSCECQHHESYSLYLYGYAQYFGAMKVINDIIGQGGDAGQIIYRDFFTDINGNLVTKLTFKPTSYNTQVPMKSHQGLKQLLKNHTFASPDPGMPLKQRYQIVIDGQITNGSIVMIQDILRESWVQDNNVISPDDIQVTINQMDRTSYVKTDGSSVTVVYYYVTIDKADSSLTTAEEPSTETLRQSFLSRGSIQLCNCEVKNKMTITTKGNLDPRNSTHVSAIEQALEQAWRETNQNYIGSLSIEVIAISPKKNETSSEANKDEQEQTIQFTVSLSGGQRGVTELDLQHPANTALNSNFQDKGLDIVIVEADRKNNDDEFPWYIPVGIILALLLILFILLIFCCIFREARRRDSKEIDNNPEDFREDNFSKEHFTMEPVAGFDNEAFRNIEQKTTGTYEVNADPDGKTEF